MFQARLATVMAAAAVASAWSGMAGAREAAPVELRVSDLEEYVLARAGPEKLAAALSATLKQIPANDPRRASPELIALRGLLDGPEAAPVAMAAPSLAARMQARFAALAPPPVAQATAPMLNAAPSFTLAAAPAQPAAQYAVVLGRFDDAALAGSVWRELSGIDPLAVKGLSANLAPIKGGGVTLLAGPLADQDTAAGRCTAFAALGMTCAPGVFTGQPLERAAGKATTGTGG